MLVGDWYRLWPAYARRQGRSQETIDRTLKGVWEFAVRNGRADIDKLDAQRLVAWSLSRPGDVRYVKTFLNDAVAAGAANTNPMASIRTPAPENKEFHLPSEDEVYAMADAMEWAGHRKIVLVAAFSGLRVSELCALGWAGVALGGRLPLLRVLKGKGGKDRSAVLFSPEALPEGPQMGSVFGTTAPRVQKLWAKARRDEGMPENFRFHDLRRFHATWLLDRGASDLDVAVQLGHFDARGVPNAELVRRVYGRPSTGAALDRLQALA
jgi:integrase/recombinase XerD